MSASNDWFLENAGSFTGQLSENEPLSKYTYYRIGGPARLFAFPKTEDDLKWLARGIEATGIPYFVLGAGSNILVSDQGFDGLVIKLGRVNLDISASDDPSHAGMKILKTGGSVAVSSLLRRCAQEGLGGMEFLTGVPGSIGGVVVMNAGTHLGEAKDALRGVEIIPLSGDGAGTRKKFSGDELKYQYRKNLYLPSGCVVWQAEWQVRAEEPAQVKAKIDETLARRKSTQPIDYPSCGSVFKNPKSSGMSAWQVVDQLGLRGHRIGDAQFAEKHSNFIINLDRAKAADVRALIELAKSRALSELGITLEEEVMFVGRF
jgi:UDP-N-acetylmuramate dehydrogenase